MKVIPEKYLRIDILKECIDCKSLYKEINHMISFFQNENEWAEQLSDVKEIFIKILQESTYVKQISENEQLSVAQRVLLLNNNSILLCQMYQLCAYFPFEDDNDNDDYQYQMLFDCILLAVKQHSKINQASITYLLELIDDTLFKSSLLDAVDYHSLEEFVNHICSIDIEKDFQSGQLLANILFKVILKQFKGTQTINSQYHYGPDDCYGVRTQHEIKITSTERVYQIFELIIYLYNREKKNTPQYSSRWIIGKYLSKNISERADISKEFVKISLDVLQNGHRSIEDVYVLDFLIQLHRNEPTQTLDIIYFLNSVVSAKKTIKHSITDTRFIYLFYGRIISSKNQKQTENINSDALNNFLNSLSMKNMVDSRQELVRLSIKFIKNNQNYQMLQKAPLSMTSERFKVSNSVVKTESALIALLDSSSSLTFEEKKKVIDHIHDVSIQKSDTFSQFFYEEFLSIFKSNDSQDNEVKMYCKQCLSDIYYFIVGKFFCEEEVIDLKMYDDRLSYILSKGLERATHLHSLLLKGLFIQNLSQKQDNLFSLMDLFLNVIYPQSITKYDPFKGLVGFIFNTYQIFYEEDYFDLKTTNNTLRLSDSLKYEEFIFKTLVKECISYCLINIKGAQWSLDLNLFSKKSFLIHKGFERILKITMKSQAIFEELIFSEDEEQLDEKKCIQFFNKYMRNQKNFKPLNFIQCLRKNRDQLSSLYKEYIQIIQNHLHREQSKQKQQQSQQQLEKNENLEEQEKQQDQQEQQQQQSLFQEVTQIMQKMISIDETIRSGDQFIKIILLNFLQPQMLERIFEESCKQFKEGNITNYESLLHFLIMVVRKCGNREYLFGGMTSQIVEFFMENYKGMKSLISLYPGKMNLKQHQIMIIDYNIRLLSLLNIQRYFPLKKDPEELIEILQRDMHNFTPQQTKRVIRMIENVDIISSSKVFSMLVRNSIDNIAKHPQDLFSNTSYIYYSMKKRNQMQDVLSNKTDPEIFEIMVNVLETHIKEPIAWGNPIMISPQNISIQLLIKVILSMIIDSESYSSTIQRNRFISILIKAMLAPKEYSPSSKASDENYLKIIAAHHLVQIQIYFQQKPKRYSSPSFSNRSSASGNQFEITDRNQLDQQNKSNEQLQQNKQQNVSITEDVLLSVSILGNNDQDSIVRRVIFHLVAQNVNKLAHPFLISLHLYLSDTEESLQILSNTIIRSYAEKHQQFFYSLPLNQEKDYSRSLQYNIIYLFYIYMNHPQYLLPAKPNWKNLQRNLWESLDMMLVNKSQYPQCYELLCSIIMRLKQATQPKHLSNIFNGINITAQNIKFKQQNIKILNEALNQKISNIQNKDVSSSDKFLLLCEISLDLIAQKWISFKKEATLKTFKLDFILPQQYYEIVSLQQRHLTDSMNFSKVEKLDNIHSQNTIKDFSNNCEISSFQQSMNKQQSNLDSNGAQIATLNKEAQPITKNLLPNTKNQQLNKQVKEEKSNKQQIDKNLPQNNSISNFFSSTKQKPIQQKNKVIKSSVDKINLSQESCSNENDSTSQQSENKLLPAKKRVVNKNNNNKKNNKALLNKL